MSTPRAAVEAETRRWLAAHYTQALDQLGTAPDPVWRADGTPRRMTAYHFQEVLRKLKIFRWLDRLEFSSAIDVGSGFDIFPELIHARYGADALYSDFTHAMNLPYGAASSRLDRAVTVNAARLPFPDNSIDLVMASEVLEHLVRPIEVIAELVRVARKYVVMTSLEALAVNRWERTRAHWHIDTRQPHVERNFFLAAELDAIFGPRWHHESLLLAPSLPASTFVGTDEQAAAYAALDRRAAVVSALVRAVSVDGHPDGAMGIVLVKPLADAPVRPANPPGDAALADWLVGQAARYQDVVLELAAARSRGETVLPARERPVAAELRVRLCCPDCRGALAAAEGGLRCAACNADFAAEHGVPILYPLRPHDAEAEAHAALERLCGADAERRRVVAQVMRRLRRNEGPPSALRRALWWLEQQL
jgi:SAM-dependent methyltransferase/uncharacterized protein YbaR (Trm112 family)